jgi:hypothetical protein
MTALSPYRMARINMQAALATVPWKPLMVETLMT